MWLIIIILFLISVIFIGLTIINILRERDKPYHIQHNVIAQIKQAIDNENINYLSMSKNLILSVDTNYLFLRHAVGQNKPRSTQFFIDNFEYTEADMELIVQSSPPNESRAIVSRKYESIRNPNLYPNLYRNVEAEHFLNEINIDHYDRDNNEDEEEYEEEEYIPARQVKKPNGIKKLIGKIFDKKKKTDENCMISYEPLGKGEQYYVCSKKPEHVYSKTAMDEWMRTGGTRTCVYCCNSLESRVYVNKDSGYKVFKVSLKKLFSGTKKNSSKLR